MSEETSFEDYVDNTSSDSSSLEAEGEVFSLKKESGDLFRSESDIETNTLEFSSEDSEAGSSISSFGKNSIEGELEDEHEETLNQSKSFNDTKHTISDSAELQQLATEDSTAHSSISSLGKGSIEDVFEDERDRIGNKSLDNADPNPTVSTKSPKIGTEALEIESSASNLDKEMIEEPIKQINVSASVEQDGTRNKLESVSNAEQSATSGNQYSLSPTEAMKALHISETPSSTSKTTQRQSRIRANTFNIFDSPYNTRLKARMIQEREMRSRSQGKPTD